jgi:glycosyltransferase involved in cell wall biosynthesis
MIAVSEYVKNEMIGLGVPPERIFVVHSGVDTDFIDSVQGSVDTEPSIVYVGNLLPHKRVSDLVNALKIIHGEFPEVSLKVVGTGPLLEALKEEARNLKIEGNIIFMGRVSDDLKIRLLKSSSALILPSVMESFGLVLLEGMACGKPVVSYDIPAAKEVVEDGRNGFLVPIGDIKSLAERIREILVNPSLARRMGDFGRNMVEKRFTWEKTAERTLDVYRRVGEHR